MNTNRKVGTLMLVEVNKQQLTIKNIVKVSNIPHLYVSGDIFGQLTPDIDGKVYLNNKASTVKARRDSIEKVYQPIIIFDDEIKDGDKVIKKGHNTIYEIEKESDKSNCIKVLVLPNQFSQEFLQAIVDGKVKENDKVEVEIEYIE